jgi:hypothetical protein
MELPRAVNKMELLRGLAELYAVRGLVTSRADYPDMPSLPLTNKTFLWSHGTIMAFLQHEFVNDEYLDRTSRIMDNIMAHVPHKKAFPLSVLLGTFLTAKVAQAVQDNLAEVLACRGVHKMAVCVAAKLEHPKFMFALHSTWGRAQFNTYAQLTPEEALQKFKVDKLTTTGAPALPLLNPDKTKKTKLEVTKTLLKMKLASAGEFTKKNIWRVYTRHKLIKSVKPHCKGDGNHYALTGPGCRKFLNVFFDRPFSANVTSNSEDSMILFSRDLRLLWQSYLSQLGILISNVEDEATKQALLQHKSRVATLDGMQFLACEFYKILRCVGPAPKSAWP